MCWPTKHYVFDVFARSLKIKNLVREAKKGVMIDYKSQVTLYKKQTKMKKRRRNTTVTKPTTMDAVKAMRRGNREAEQEMLGPGFHSWNRLHQSKKTYTRKEKHRTLLCILALLLCSVSLMAQNTMKVYYKDGTEQDISISKIDSVSFSNQETAVEDVSLTGSWFWGKTGAEYYELITFSDDHTYTGYDNYFTYGFDTMTYGWYSLYGNMLTLQSNGYGYQRMYNWFVIGLTSNALEVMTRMGPFTYYRLKPEVLYISSSGVYTGFADDDAIVFADGVTVKADGNKLQSLSPGTTYILVRNGEDKIWAYKVIVRG